MRTDGWPRLLNEYLLESQGRFKTIGYKPGEFDCCIFVSDWVQICLGSDPMIEFRGRYETEEEGLVLVAGFDGSLRNALQSRFGESHHPSVAQRGDILFSERLNACGICIVQGTRMLGLFLGKGGFAMHRIRDCDCVFRVA